MKTEKLFVTDVYKKEANLNLVAIDGDKLAFTSTIFFPTGGGQLCDTGEINGVKVLNVKEEKNTGIIWHQVEDVSGFEIGKEYRAILDWEKRFNHMQLHCGEHLLSGAFYKLYGASNKGFHMGEEYVTIDIDLPGQELTKEMISNAENLANEFIRMNLPVKTYFFDTAKEAMQLPCRKEIKFNDNISVVLIGDANDAADCCACCGTHPMTTGEIGLIKITHSEKYKGMTRFYVKCGMTAMADYTNLQSIVEKLCRHYSCDAFGLENAVSANDKRYEEFYKRYSTIKDHCITLAIKEAESMEEQGKTVLNFDYFTADDLQQVAKELKPKKLIALTSEKERSCILVSDGSIACGQLIKEASNVLNCKGGGKNNLARAIFATQEDLSKFINDYL